MNSSVTLCDVGGVWRWQSEDDVMEAVDPFVDAGTPRSA